MDERDWYLLSLIGKKASLSQISEELFISQPALSYRINKIEEFFGVDLLIRTNKGFQVTTEGEILIKYTNQHLENVNRIREDMYSIKDIIKGPLKIGASSAIAQYLLPPVLSKFHTVYKDVNLNLTTGFSPTLIENLIQNKIHIAFLREDIEWNSYKKLLASDGIYLVSRYPIQIANLPYLNRVEYKTNLSLRTIIDNWWSQHFKQRPVTSIIADNAEACKEMVRNELGYAILTGLTLNNQSDLSYVPLKSNNEKLMRHTWIYATKEAMNYVTVRTFLDFLEQEVQPYQGL
ncbi:putative HTH-type transcriptional regulator YraN [Lentibacillus kapialis]|uniref:HTH-type transcriptional regulator YraN n=1 Tax=Lentibacillus kapialis TaxID=340214 RepID=A0A917PZB2_9BACI|nr:LysR family transcriptional regulator [Lentibacillus kapialis]GGK01574.1 putative HTH-type transcriptional regulator YraN [Lentibacillus kapialis]